LEPLPILWQRLVKDGETCARCGATEAELRRALDKLALVLPPLDIEPVLETQEIDEADFKVDPAQSNRIWIAGIPIEDWLGAIVGRSRCCAVCGDSDCRTLALAGQSFEAIPEALIVEAALRAAAPMIAARKSAIVPDRLH
jgi:hypothetical protein